MEELIDVLDENGNKTGEILPRNIVHQKDLFHRIAAVCVMDKDNNILMQQRSKNVDSSPLKWDITAAGHVTSSHESEETAIRELNEEVGIKVSKDELNYLITYKSDTNHFIDCYIVIKDYIDIKKLHIQKSEVEQIKLCTINEVNKMINEKIVVNRDEFYKKFFENINVM